MKTIVVTGGRGFIGTAMLRRLATVPDTRVLALARARPLNADPAIHWIEGSLQDLRPSHWSGCGPAPVDAVLHLAAFTPKIAAERDCAAEIIAANILGTQTLLASLPRPPRRVVFCSTLDVYARSAFDGAVDERSPIGPAGLYGSSKLFGEGLVAAYARASGVEHVSLRIGHVYGPGEERYAKLVPETIRRVLTGQPPRMVGEGREQRDLLYVDDAVEALMRACSVPLGGVGTVNVARGESYSIRDVVTTITRLAGFEGSIQQLAPADSYSTVFDTSLMTRVLGAWTFVSLADGLAREIAHARAVAAPDS